MARLMIDGGRPLAGGVSLAGAKNSSFKLMVAALLCPGECRLNNLSRIAEVNHVAGMIRALGGRVRLSGSRAVIDSRGIGRAELPVRLGKLSRASTLFLAPLLARFGRALVPLPGGDAIGHRPLDRHFAALKELGAHIRIRSGLVRAEAPVLRGSHYRFNKNSHTATETMLMAAVLARGKTVIANAAIEPEVDDLIGFLNRMGAKITRRDKTITVSGVLQLHPAEYPVMPDRNQAVSYAVAALATGGEVVVKNARVNDLTVFLDKLKLAGAGTETDSRGIRFFSRGRLKATDIRTGPHPGFMTDWQPLWSVLMTQAVGRSKITETVFTRRFQFVPDLRRMGAKIGYFDPRPADPDRFYNFNLTDDDPARRHGIAVTGPTPLAGGNFTVFDIRAGATLAIAGLAARGRTVLTRAELIDRGYEDFAGNLSRLGAKIKRIN